MSRGRRGSTYRLAPTREEVPKPECCQQRKCFLSGCSSRASVDEPPRVGAKPKELRRLGAGGILEPRRAASPPCRLAARFMARFMKTAAAAMSLNATGCDPPPAAPGEAT
eukprot:3045456-Prymnesium_polylepis.2